MPHDRYFLDAPLLLRHCYSLEENEWHHLVNVSRTKVGETVELVNGQGQLALAVVQELKKKSAELLIESVTCENSPKPPLILALAMPRRNHLEWIIEKGTELNVTSFWLFPGILSEKEQLSDSQRQRLHHLGVAAMKQCGRLDLPSIESKPPLLQFPPLEGTLLFGDTSSEAPYLWSLNLSRPPPLPIILFIGPERGFDPKEHTFLQQTLKAQGVRLHPNILRAETAPLVGLSLIQTLLTSN